MRNIRTEDDGFSIQFLTGWTLTVRVGSASWSSNYCRWSGWTIGQNEEAAENGAAAAEVYLLYPSGAPFSLSDVDSVACSAREVTPLQLSALMADLFRFERARQDDTTSPDNQPSHPRLECYASVREGYRIKEQVSTEREEDGE